jgi:hypothetical protein
VLFHVTWQFHNAGEEAQRRSLTLFQQWQPPEGALFHGFYGTADGRGGVAIVEAPDAQTVYRTVDPWTPWLTFDVTPILPIEEASAIGLESVAWRDSIA